MALTSQTGTDGGWVRASGLREIARALGLAVHPAKLGLALAGILLTLAYGWILDAVWKQSGGVPADTIARYIEYRQQGRTYVEPTGPAGIFEAWREHERECVLGLLGSPVLAVAPATALGNAVGSRAALAYLPWYTNLAFMGRGVWWMARFHPLYFLFFGVGTLLIWALMGGAICRIAAVQFARDEKIAAREALRYSWKRLIGGFALAPLIPVVFIIIISIFLIIGGIFLRIPVLGDLAGAPLFLFALLGGLVIAVLMVGMIIGGGFFWPAVAVEGADAFDSFSRSLAYPFSRPWKTVIYFFLAGIYTVISWLVASLLITWAVLITRLVVSWGTSPFGWWQRADSGTKLDVLWPLGGASGLHAWPDWSQLFWYEKYSAFFIGVYVLLAIALMWAFLFSFGFSVDTIIYFLLRRDVDGNELNEVHMEEGQSAGSPAEKPAASTASESPSP